MTKYNELQVTANKDRKRVGRGIAAGGGKTAGRGTKGQGSRTGKKLGANFMGGQRSLVTAVPKHRGFKSLRTPAQVVYLDHLNDFAGKTVDNIVLFGGNDGRIKVSIIYEVADNFDDILLWFAGEMGFKR